MTARRWLVRIAAILSIIVPIPLAAEAAIGWPVDAAVAIYSVVIIAFAVMGWLVSERQPSNLVGPLMIAVAFLFALSMPFDVYPRVPGSHAGADIVGLLVSFVDAPLLAILALTLIRFPDGLRPTPRWRWVDWLVVAVFGVAFVGTALRDGPYVLYPHYRSPFGIPGYPGDGLVYLGYIGMFVLLVAAAASLVVRWRRGGMVERGQIKWIAAAAVITLIAECANVATFRGDNPNSPAAIASAIAFALVPIAMGVAILRYRLYEIDRIISRTIAYALVIVIIGVVFGGGVVLLSSALASFADGQTVAVAGATLVAYATFQPALRRVRHVVDRRFDRTRFDSERTADSFAERLREGFEIETVTADLEATIRSSIRPASVWLWLRRAGR
jgi:hypothetical protein